MKELKVREGNWIQQDTGNEDAVKHEHWLAAPQGHSSNIANNNDPISWRASFFRARWRTRWWASL